MQLPDAAGRARIDAARNLVSGPLARALHGRFHTELWTFGDTLSRADSARVCPAGARRSDIAGALAAVRDRYRGRSLAGIVVLSDGGQTGTDDAAGAVNGGAAVYTVGIGPTRVPHDIEVLDVGARGGGAGRGGDEACRAGYGS